MKIEIGFQPAILNSLLIINLQCLAEIQVYLLHLLNWKIYLFNFQLDDVLAWDWRRICSPYVRIKSSGKPLTGNQLLWLPTFDWNAVEILGSLSLTTSVFTELCQVCDHWGGLVFSCINYRGRTRKSVYSGSACSTLYLQIPCRGKNGVWQCKLSGLYHTPHQISHFIIRLGRLPNLEEEEIEVWTSFSLYAFLF